MQSVSNGWRPTGDSKLIYAFLPRDSSRQSDGLREVRKVSTRLGKRGESVRLVDLGCGSARSHDDLVAGDTMMRWVGLDILDSPEAMGRLRTDLPICAYDGVRIPLTENSVDITYSRQVFEHVRHPEQLIAEVLRVLRPGGWFVGSTSHLEPFHSRSYWNYTPYGFCTLLRDAGFQSICVRPGIDALTLISRRGLSYLGLSPIFKPFFKVESPFNLLLEAGMRVAGVPVKRRNFLKLVFAGHFCFSAQK